MDFVAFLVLIFKFFGLGWRNILSSYLFENLILKTIKFLVSCFLFDVCDNQTTSTHLPTTTITYSGKCPEGFYGKYCDGIVS